jgi:hypothetical protein
VTPNNFRPYPSLSAPLLSDYAQGTACCLDLGRGSGTEAGDGGATQWAGVQGWWPVKFLAAASKKIDKFGHTGNSLSTSP